MGELSGLKILAVEDEPLVAMTLEGMLTDLGSIVVGPAGDLRTGMQLAKDERIDGAVLDVNLGGEMVFPLADFLAQRGIPFVYVTGYGATILRQCDHERPSLQKPYKRQELSRIAKEWRPA